MPTLVIKGPDGDEQEQDFSSSLTIGRAEGNDLILAEGGVSRKHARFFLEGGVVMVEDLGSANGTIVNGERIDGPTALDASASVVLGDYEVQLKESAKSRPKADRSKARPSGRPTTVASRQPLGKGPERSTKVVPVMKPAASSATGANRRTRTSEPTLRGLSGAVTGKAFPLRGTMVIGRVPDVDLRIDDDSVSRRHAEIQLSGTQTTLRDLGSANGTTVNGEPISETTLNPGDIIQFGVIEMMYEAGARSALTRSQRSSGSAVARRDEPDEPTSAEASKRRLFMIGGAVLALLVLAAVIHVVLPSGDPPVVPTKRPPPPKQVDPADQVEELLKVCRTYSNCEGKTANWPKAREACQAILNEDPIHEQARQLIKRIDHEKAAEEALAKGKELVASGRLEQALDSFARIRPFSKEVVGCFFLETLDAAKAVIQDVKKARAQDCKSYAQNAKWEFALRRCEAYMELACQSMKAEDLEPPYPLKVKLEGPLGKTGWRPKDPNFVNFLKARERSRVEEPWACPDIPAFHPLEAAPDPTTRALMEFQEQYKNKDEGMGRAVVLYFQGSAEQATNQLQQIRDKVSKAALHREVDELKADISNAFSFFKAGNTELANDRPEKAEAPFRKALALDEEIVLGEKRETLSEEQKKRELEKNSSFLRRTIIEGMTNTTYLNGKTLADKKDYRAACKVWKLGFSFSRAHNDLAKAIFFCTGKAADAFKEAETCEQLKVVLDLATEGDGVLQEAQETFEQKCK